MRAIQTLTLIVCILFNANAEAQLLKKLKDKLNKKERTEDQSPTKNDSISKEEQEAAEKKMAAIFGGGLEGVPDSYAFSYVLTYNIKADKDEIPFQYFLEPNAPYFANKTEDPRSNSLIVYDLKKNFMVTFMDNGQQKMAMKMKLPNMKKVQQKYGDKLFTEENEGEVKITPIESKNILGYNCLGFKVVTYEGEGKMWITNDAPVSLNNLFGNFKTLSKSGPYANMPINENTLVMEMEFQSSKKRKDNMHMLCTELKQQVFEIQKKDYKTGM